MAAKPTKTKPKAREKLDRSRLRPDKLEGMGDIDLEDFVLHLRNKFNLDVVGKITDAPIDRTVEGASTLAISVKDDELELLRSNLLHVRTDVEVDGLWFRLAAIDKTGRDLTLTFEDREIAVLKTYNQKKIVQRSNMTRAEFILSLIKEVKEFDIPYVIPELHKVQPVAEKVGTGVDFSSSGGGPGGSYGFPPNANKPKSDKHRGQKNTGLGLTVKGELMTKAQLRVASNVLGVGTSMGARRKVLVCSMMTAIQESTMTNLAGGDRDSVGVFQQRASWGSYEDRHTVATAARLFFREALKEDNKEPALTYSELCQAVQRSAFPDAYAKWRDEGEVIVSAYGVPGSDMETSAASANASQDSGFDSSGGAAGPYHYYRGIPPGQGDSSIKRHGKAKWKKEDSWTCIQRLASEVNWRAFFVSGTFYLLTEDYLFKSQPVMSITEETDGIDTIDFNYDKDKKNASITVQCSINRWAAPPGSVVHVHDMGIVTGRWLVENVHRSLFSIAGEITLKKPLPALPEPLTDALNQQAGWGGSTDQAAGSKTYIAAGALVQPVPKPFNKGHGVRHDTTGLPGYPAYDFMAHVNSPVIAPEAIYITRFSGHDPDEGAVMGAGGPLGWSIYARGLKSGSDYYFTHLKKRTCKVGQTIGLGQQIGTIADYFTYGRDDHVHVGVHGGSVSIEMLGSAEIAVAQ